MKLGSNGEIFTAKKLKGFTYHVVIGLSAANSLSGPVSGRVWRDAIDNIAIICYCAIRILCEAGEAHRTVQTD